MQLDPNIQSYLYIAVSVLAFFIVFFIAKDMYGFFKRRSTAKVEAAVANTTEQVQQRKQEIIEQQMKEDNQQNIPKAVKEPVKEVHQEVKSVKEENHNTEKIENTDEKDKKEDENIIVDSTRNIFEETAPKSDLDMAKENLQNKTTEPEKTYRVEEQVHSDFTYKELVSELYRSRGYTISTHGISDNQEIQLIAKKGREIFLMQCHKVDDDSKKFINSKHLTHFMNQARDFVKNNKLYRHYELSLICVASKDVIEETGQKYVARKKNVYYEVVPL
jgi:hypothetical protein